MRHVTFSEARQNFAATLNRVEEDAEPAVITRVGHDPMVVISLREYESLRETAYLQASPANARRLEAAIERHRQGEVEEHELAGNAE
ncbi:type II toxin-antitoxin system Phd/YefM family antitoxin [Dactylosporangium sucinum]|uniref:Antitoxin n=1 Tax=Dactylosporangium sucinum TaxID=1424081 RepID=A0A917WX53_9ACTN|nr:type II toxin-antitoxin system prevent-host-death family antitoxin [Dactylosporangium sucinum]GGM41255.1 antitoxin YefM [Dactylosporangium sucinum]